MSIDMLFFVRSAGACTPQSLVVPVSSSGSPEPEQAGFGFVGSLREAEQGNLRTCSTVVMRVDGIQTHGEG